MHQINYLSIITIAPDAWYIQYIRLFAALVCWHEKSSHFWVINVIDVIFNKPPVSDPCSLSFALQTRNTNTDSYMNSYRCSYRIE
jgi:hypothetical protein